MSVTYVYKFPFMLYSSNPRPLMGITRELRTALVKSMVEKLAKAPIHEAIIDIQRQLSMMEKYAIPNWDGEGATPVSHSGIINCAVFLGTKIEGRLPPPTDFQVDPDGWISLEWYNDQSNLLEISFGPADKAMYSALIGGTGHCGDINLFDKRISKPLSAVFEELDDNNPSASHRECGMRIS